jgi:hypothetical protein
MFAGHHGSWGLPDVGLGTFSLSLNKKNKKRYQRFESIIYMLTIKKNLNGSGF